MPSLRQSIIPGASQPFTTRSEPRGNTDVSGVAPSEPMPVLQSTQRKGVLNMHESTPSSDERPRRRTKKLPFGGHALTCLQKTKATDHVDLLQGACRCHTAPAGDSTPAAPALQRIAPEPAGRAWAKVERAARVGLVGWDGGSKDAHSEYHFSKPSISSAAKSLGCQKLSRKC